MLVCPGGLVHVGCLWDECVSAVCFVVSTKLDQLVSRGPVGWVRGPGMWGEQRSQAGTRGIPECTCACECGVCVCPR